MLSSKLSNAIKAIAQLAICAIFIASALSCSEPISEREKELTEHVNKFETDQRKVWDLINASQSCNIDADCKLVDLGCPFGCGIGLNTSKEAEVAAVVKDFHDKHSLCVYKCKASLAVSCVSNVCIAQ